ncbi:MAG: chemotaxis protein CheB [Thermodesulfobacteriota bacterium]
MNWARPSIDVLFESAAEAYGRYMVGVILTGAGEDGARGLAWIKDMGGLTVAQDPEAAEAPDMPKAAIEATHVDFILPLEGIGRLLGGMVKEGRS